MVNIIFSGFRFRISGNRISTLRRLYDRTIPTLISYFTYVTTQNTRLTWANWLEPWSERRKWNIMLAKFNVGKILKHSNIMIGRTCVDQNLT